MSIVSICSLKSNAKEIAEEFKSKSDNIDPVLILFFTSSHLNVGEISKEITKNFPSSNVAGCTTAGELISGAMLKDSVVAMLISQDIIEDVQIGVVPGIKEQTRIDPVFSSFETHFGVSMSKMDLKKYAGMILLDGLSGAEEKIIERIGDLTDITFIGGSAGDDLAFKQTLLCANGETYTDAAVLILMKLRNGFDIIKTQSFSSTGKKLIATKVDEAERTVIEFNNKPATEVYAGELGISESDCSSKFMSNPVGLIIENEPYVRSPQRTKDSSIVFYCNIREGMQLDILKSEDIVSDTQKAVTDKLKQHPRLKGIINFHCILRTLELEQNDLCDTYGKLFSKIPMVGFSTYGEAYIGHINQTSTMFVFL